MFGALQKRPLAMIAKLTMFSQVLLLCSVSLAESDEFRIVSIYSEDAEIKEKIRALYFEEFEARSDLLIYYIEYSGYKCGPTTDHPDYDYFCDLTQPVRARSRMTSEDDWGIIWVGFRRSILIKFLKDDIRISVTSGIIAP